MPARLFALMTRILTVIPTLNAAAGLPACLASLAEGEKAGLNAGWVVADARSSDQTLAIARHAGCKIVTGAKGRGAQLALGAEAGLAEIVRVDWLLFVHADTRLEPGWTGPVRRFCQHYHDQNQAAYFRFGLDDPGLSAKRLERAVRWRCRTLALPYGDQGLLISKRFYQSIGGFKPWPLFEDVDLVRRIGRRRLKALPAGAITSAERFKREGYYRRSAQNLWLLARYFLGENPQSLAEAYRKR